MIFDDLAKIEITNMVTTKYEKIKVIPGKCRYNFRCQMNAVHEAIENKQTKIAMCIYFDDDFPIIHFLNIDENNNYIDNTLGHWSSQHNYYFVKIIHKDEFFNINIIFTNFKKQLRKQLSFFVKLLSNYEC